MTSDIRFPNETPDYRAARDALLEAAGLATGGRSALAVVRNGAPANARGPATAGKAAQLLARSDIAEVHLSLWCASPRISILERVKP